MGYEVRGVRDGVCGAYGYESETVDDWLDELADQLEKR